VKDPLLDLTKEIRDHSASLGLTVFYSLVPEDEAHAVYWIEEHGGDWKNFLQCAKALDTRIVYLSWEPFEESEVDDALAQVDESNRDQDADESQRGSARAQIESFRKKAGLTAFVDIGFSIGGISHIYRKFPEWFDSFQELTADEPDEVHDAGEERIDSTLVSKWARQLASHPKYGSCKSDDQREFLLEQLAGEDFAKIPLWPTIRRAETIYQLEMKGKEEERLSSQAQELRNQGLNMNAIAKRLGISRDRVSGLLAEGSRKTS